MYIKQTVGYVRRCGRRYDVVPRSVQELSSGRTGSSLPLLVLPQRVLFLVHKSRLRRRRRWRRLANISETSAYAGCVSSATVYRHWFRARRVRSRDVRGLKLPPIDAVSLNDEIKYLFIQV